MTSLLLSRIGVLQLSPKDFPATYYYQEFLCEKGRSIHVPTNQPARRGRLPAPTTLDGNTTPLLPRFTAHGQNNRQDAPPPKQTLMPATAPPSPTASAARSTRTSGAPA